MQAAGNPLCQRPRRAIELRAAPNLRATRRTRGSSA